MNTLLTDAIAFAATLGRMMFRAILAPLESFSPVWGISVIGCITGIIILLVFRYASSPAKIAEAKNRLKGDLLEIWLFNHDVRLVLKTQFRLFLSSIRYIGHTIFPLLILSVPVGGITMLMENWYGARPLALGEDIIVTLKFEAGSNTSLDSIRMKLPAHIEFAAPPVRIPSLAEISWKLNASGSGNAPLICVIDGEKTEISFEVSGHIRPVYASMRHASLTHALLSFGSFILPAQSKIESIRLAYPAREIRIFGRNVHWLLLHLIATILFVLLLMKKFRVTL